jgi:hypothetical protein
MISEPMPQNEAPMQRPTNKAQVVYRTFVSEISNSLEIEGRVRATPCSQRLSHVSTRPTVLVPWGLSYLSANQPNPARTKSSQLYRPMFISWIALLITLLFTVSALVLPFSHRAGCFSDFTLTVISGIMATCGHIVDDLLAQHLHGVRTIPDASRGSARALLVDLPIRRTTSIGGVLFLRRRG